MSCLVAMGIMQDANLILPLCYLTLRFPNKNKTHPQPLPTKGGCNKTSETFTSQTSLHKKISQIRGQVKKSVDDLEENRQR